MDIFGYDWKNIQAAQQGGKLTGTLPAKRTATVRCFQCKKYFPLPDITKAESHPVQCTHCGYAHNYHKGPPLTVVPLSQTRKENKVSQSTESQKPQGEATSKEVLAANNAKSARQRILGAHVGIDLCKKRGEVCRGAYIADALGIFYMTHQGTWTKGIEGDGNWWNDKIEAENFLASQQAANAAETKLCNPAKETA